MNFLKYNRCFQSVLTILLTLSIYFNYNLLIIIFLSVGLIILINLEVIIDITYQKYYKNKQLQRILKECVKSIEKFQNRQGKNTLRANIMILNKNMLRILVSYRMDNYLDKDITFAIGQGCCGDAYDSKQIVVGDLGQIYQQTWEKTRMEACQLWGLSREHFEKTRDIKSIISIPITNKDNEVVCILNFDDKVSLLDSKFDEEILQQIIGGYAFFILYKIEWEGY